MSYLHSPRLIFTGDFKSDVSTVNNDPAHYNNKTFESSFQEFGEGSTNGWWNPEGGASFTFQDCIVRQITLPDGSTTSSPADDIVLSQVVADADDRATGKMVDLDPQQQGTSELWAVKLLISTTENELLLQGDVKPTGFRDLQMRQTGGSAVNGQPLGGTWTSLLVNLEWGKRASDSQFLQKLKAATHDDKLSLNLHSFGYYYRHAPNGRFSLGRLMGSIGPWLEGEPELFAPARRLYGILSRSGAVFFGTGNFLFEKNERRLTLDLGGSFPVADSIGTVNLTSKLVVGVSNKTLNSPAAPAPVILQSSDFIAIGPVNYSTGDWLDKTGGIIVFDGLSTEAVTALEGNQLVLLTPTSAPGSFAIVAREAIDGYVVKADNFVQRLDSGQTNHIDIFAYKYGKALANQEIAVTLEPPTPVEPLNPPANPISEIPGNNYPADGLNVPASIKTGPEGRASLPLTGNPIHNPRGYIDGQIYFVDYQLQDIDNDAAEASVMPQEIIYVHLRDHFEVPANPVWSDIAEIMTQFGNLYPIMSKYIVNLEDPLAVKKKKDILIFAFTREIEDTLHMPVTRDLSDAKRQTILNWLASADIGIEAIEKSIGAAPATAGIVPESPAEPGADLTDKQIKLKNAMRAKSGAMLTAFEEVETLFEGL